MPLLLDLLRHGEAGPKGPDGDPARPLTPAGEAAVRALARRLAARGERPGRVFASPLLRAQQSAEIVLAQVSPGLVPEVLEELEPDRDPGELAAALRAHRAAEGLVLLVGHLPLLDRMCVWLTGQAAGFAPATLQRIGCPGGPERGGGTLVLTLGPESRD